MNQMILNLWEENETIDQRNYANYNVGKKIIDNTEVLKFVIRMMLTLW